jgi:VWFA-related protein
LTYGSNEMKLNQLNEGVKNFSEILSRTAKSLTNANIAIYPVDARSLMAVAPSNTGVSMSVPNPSLVSGGASTARQAVRLDDQATDEAFASRSTMQELADQTGGRASYDTNDVRGAIRQAIEDSRVTYTFGYYPSDTKFDGKFRSIKVSVRRPGVQVKYRRRYTRFPTNLPMTLTATRSSILRLRKCSTRPASAFWWKSASPLQEERGNS